MCVQTQMLPTHIFTSLIHPFGLIYTLFNFLFFLASASLNSLLLLLILYSSLCSFPSLPYLTPYHFPSLFLTFPLIFSLCSSVPPCSLLLISVCPPHLLFSPHLLPLSEPPSPDRHQGRGNASLSHAQRQTAKIKEGRKRLLFLCILRQM